MSMVKRQLAAKRSRITLGTLDKFPAVSPIECRQSEYLMRYGKNWVRHWWKDHPGMCDMTPFSGDSRKMVGTGMKTLVHLAEPLELIKSDKHPLFAHGYGTVGLDGWVFKAKITVMGGHAERLLSVGEIPVVGTLRESPNGYQFSVREVLSTKPEEAM